MYPLDMNNCTALDIIQRSVTCHPTTFVEALQARRDEDWRFAATREGRTRESVTASANATQRAINAVESGDLDSLYGDLSAGIIALNVAARLQCLPPHVRTQAAIRQWPME